MRQEVLDDTLLFLGPLPPEMVEERKNIEAAIIRRLKDRAHSEVEEFVYNKRPRGLKFTGILEIQPPEGVIIERLTEPFADAC